MKKCRKEFRKLSKRKRELKEARKAKRMAEIRAGIAEETAEYYKSRFRAFGNNVKTVADEGQIRTLEWTVENKPYGDFIVGGFAGKQKDELRQRLAESIAYGLIEHNMIQFISKNAGSDYPLFRGTLAAKLFVVPWEQMPHKRTITLRQYVDETLEHE